MNETVFFFILFFMNMHGIPYLSKALHKISNVPSIRNPLKGIKDSIKSFCRAEPKRWGKEEERKHGYLCLSGRRKA